MAGSVNKVILVGNLGRDPEIRSMPNGDRVANLSLATSESWRDKSSGERKEKTEWHRVSIFNDNIVKVAEQYLKKGSSIYVEGRFSVRKYTDKDGVEKYATTIKADSMQMLGGKAEGGTSEQRPNPGPPARSGAGYQAAPQGRSTGPIDDDIPF